LRHWHQVECAALSPDGECIASSEGVGGITLWDAATGKQLRHIPPPPCPINPYRVGALAFSPDGKTLAGGDGVISLWEVGTGRELFQVRDTGNESYTAFAFSPDGKTLASASAGHHFTGEGPHWVQESVVRMWDAATGRKLEALRGHQGSIASVAFSPDGKTVASAGEDHTVRLWAAATAEERQSLNAGDRRATQVAFSADGKTLAWGNDDGGVVVWDLGRQEEARRLQAGRGSVRSLAFSPADKALAVGCEFRAVSIWDTATAKELPGPGASIPASHRATFSRDGKTLVVWGDDQVVHLWDMAGGRERRPADGPQGAIRAVAMAPDCKTVATAGEDGVRLWDAATGREMWRGKGPGEASTKCVAFAPDGKSLASGGYDESIYLWDVVSGRELQQIKTGEGGVFQLAFAPDGRSLYSGGYYLVSAWDTSTGLLIREKGKRPTAADIHMGRQITVSSLQASGDGRLVAANLPGTLRVWEADTGAWVRGLPKMAHARTAAFSPDGRMLLATGSGRDVLQNVLFRWELGGDTTRGWEAPDALGRVSLSFAPDGRTVASACEDGRVLLWDVITGEVRRTYRGHRGGVSGAAFSPDGRTVVSYSPDCTAIVWDAEGITLRHGGEEGNQAAGGQFWSETTAESYDWADPDEETAVAGTLRWAFARHGLICWGAILGGVTLLGALVALRLSRRKRAAVAPQQPAIRQPLQE
jgi:WD40 repeat protein